MAIGIDGITVHADAAGGTAYNSFSFSHGTYGLTDGDRLLLVMVKMRNGPNISVTSLTANSTAMTKLAGASAVNEYSSNQHINIETWYLLDAPTGSITVAGSMSDNATSHEVTAVTLVNVAQSNTFGVTATNTGSSNTPGVTLSNVTGEGSWLLTAAAKRRATGGSFDLETEGLEELAQGQTGTGATGDISYYDAYLGPLSSGTSSYTLDPTMAGNSSQWTAVGFQVMPAVDAGAAARLVNPPAPLRSLLRGLVA